MDARHARPMTAYAALCAVAVVVLAQGVTAPQVPGIADAVARAGQPAPLLANLGTIYTFSAQSLGDLGGDVGRTAARTMVTPVAPVIAAVAPGVERIATAGDSSREKRRATAKASATRSEADSAVAVAGQPDALQRSRVLTPTGRADAKADRKADRAAASHDRKADRARASDHGKAQRAAAKADRKADRAAAKAQRQAARAKHRR